jgi:hypothetical protein
MKINQILFFLVIISILIISCCFQSKEEVEFKEFYFGKIDEIINYNNNMSTIGFEYTENYWLSFYETTEYLTALTKHKFRYSSGEPPFYLKESDFEKDIKDLKMWYENNKSGMTIKVADSLVNANHKKW